MALNWNAALAWLSAWAAEKAGPGSPVDTTAPSTPSGLTASVSGGSVSLSWGASTDDVGVTGYDVLRATGSSGTFTQVGSASGTSHTDNGLSAGSYRYQVRARDAAGNTSSASAEVSVTVQGGGVGCTVVATTQSQWGTGYVMQPVRVTNTGASAITWTVTFTLPSGHSVLGSWNAGVSTNGQTVTARAIRTLAPGATAEFGFQAARPNGNTALPSGYTCTG